MSKYLILVDYQNDFVEGVLGSKRAQSIYENIKKKIEEKLDEGWHIIFTMDTHDGTYLNTMEGKKLPVVHCSVGSFGWKIYRNLDLDVKKMSQPHKEVWSDECETVDYSPLIVVKKTFGYDEWKRLIPDATEIEVIGVCTDICVVSNAIILKAQFPESKISVDASCCAGVTKESHMAALKTMEACHIEVYNSDK